VGKCILTPITPLVFCPLPFEKGGEKTDLSGLGVSMKYNNKLFLLLTSVFKSIFAEIFIG
jgi:hypothetical protein